MAVATELGDVELVSVDSMQVYRGMDIGTAKPTADERRRVRHHGLDLVEASEEFTVAEFQPVARRALDDIDARGARAVLVGGTGLYHRVVVDDFDIPGRFAEVRSELDEMVDSSSDPVGEVERLHARLAGLDPAAAAKIEPENRRRVVRALEVTLGSGRPFSSFGPGVDVYPPSPVVQIALRRPRDVVARRVERRVHAMVEEGLVDEVARLHSVGMSHTALQALGYKEIVEHLEGRWTLDQAIDATVVRTRQFAVRQERWFRRDSRVRWVEVGHDPVADVAPVVIAALDETDP